jgi:hypothetical protein
LRRSSPSSRREGIENDTARIEEDSRRKWEGDTMRDKIDRCLVVVPLELLPNVVHSEYPDIP